MTFLTQHLGLSIQYLTQRWIETTQHFLEWRNTLIKSNILLLTVTKHNLWSCQNYCWKRSSKLSQQTLLKRWKMCIKQFNKQFKIKHIDVNIVYMGGNTARPVQLQCFHDLQCVLLLFFLRRIWSFHN